MQHPSAPKYSGSRQFVYPLTKNLDLVTMEGETWKTWRARFNPGFSGRNMMVQVPEVLEEVQLFVDTIKSKAGKDGGWGEVFQMEGHTINLTFDVIGRSSLGVSFETQRRNELGLREALADISSLLIFETNIFTIWKRISPIRKYRLWRDHQVIDRILLPQIEKELRRTKDEGYGSHKTVLELAVKNAKEELTSGGMGKLDDRFVETVLSQLKVFLFAGHDTTATSICWAFHLLQKNPEALGKMRDEHDKVFGKDTRITSQILRQNPALINAIPYTTSIVKETLRLYPNIASARQGSADLNLVGVPGYADMTFPTEGLMIWDGIQAMHMRDDLWVGAGEFVPERWMVKEGDPLHPPKNAFRTFAVGPRNCIGKELAMLEVKLALVMLAREVDLEEAWEEWDRQIHRTGKPEVFNGERLYQISGTTPHPKDGMPVHVRLRQQ
jgi:cytochrome P450